MAFCHREGNIIKPPTRAELERFDKEQLIDIILLLFEQSAALELKVAELEERLNQNSTNSSKPPSSEIPCRVSSDLHEWCNGLGAVSVMISVKL